MTAAQREAELLDAWSTLSPMYGYQEIDPIVPIAQSAHETNGFTSNLIVNHNNAFGFKRAQSRDLDEPSGVFDTDGTEFAAYPSLAVSVEDYLERQTDYGVDQFSELDYIEQTVDSGYAGDPNYLVKWQRWILELGGEDAYAFDDEPGPVAETGGNDYGALALLILVGISATSRN